MDKNKLLDACTGLVAQIQGQYVGWDGIRQFQGTPGRLTRMYEELCWDQLKITEELEKQLKVFKEKFNEMLVAKPIKVRAVCPHHLLPCLFDVTIGYIPDGAVLGLSKFARIAEIMGRRPILQEEYSRELAEFLESRLEPKGVAVYVVGSHNCMSFRGIKQDSKVVTSVLKGVFMEPVVRAEFFAIARGSNG